MIVPERLKKPSNWQDIEALYTFIGVKCIGMY